MTNRTRARATGAFLLPLIILMPLPASGGACWSKVNSLGRCKEMLSQGVTREQCCSSAARLSGQQTHHHNHHYRNHNYNHNHHHNQQHQRIDNNGNSADVAIVVAAVATGPETMAYSDEDYDNGQLFFWQVLGGGVRCDSCRSSCEGVSCPTGRRCVLRRGMPRCLCARPDECESRSRLGEPRGPVCGTDGRTYRSLCELKRRACRAGRLEPALAYAGQCRSSCAGVRCRHGRSCLLDQNLSAHCVKCSRRCNLNTEPAKARPFLLLADQQQQQQYDEDVVPSNLRPVCGVDGNTYKSACHLRAAACRAGSAIAIAYSGPCRKHKDCKSVECRPGQLCLEEPGTSRPRCVTCKYRCPRGSRELVRQRNRHKERDHQDSSVPALCASNNLTYPSWCHIMKDACLTGVVLETRHAGPCHAKDPPAFHNSKSSKNNGKNDDILKDISNKNLNKSSKNKKHSQQSTKDYNLLM